jgi:NhaP-type Na+/H+ or K+/H+ antiporter
MIILSGAEVHAAPYAGLLLCMSLGIGVRIAMRVVPKRFQLPYTCVVFLAGLLVATFVKFLSLGPVMDASIKLFFNVGPSFILLVLLPPLLFESASAVDYHIFAKVSGQALLLAFPGVVLSMGFTGLFLKGLFYDYEGWGWMESFLLGSILSATDPVAVVAALSELGASPKLSSLIEGESLLNDGSAFVFFLMLQDLVAGHPKPFGEAFGFFFQLALGGPLWGAACAVVVYVILRLVYDDPILEVSLVVFSVFTVFFIAEDLFHVSGVLAVVVFGLGFANRIQFAMSPEVEHAHHALWQQLAFVANTLIFFISGLLIVVRVADGSVGRSWYDWWTLIVLYVGLHVIRASVTLILSPLLTRMGYGLPWKSGAILVWGGLRGAVGLALGLLLELDSAVNRNTVAVVNFHVAGIVFMTLMINGTTTELVYRKLLKLGQPLVSQQRLALDALKSIEEDADHELPHIKSEFFFENIGIDWKYVKMLSPNLQLCKFTPHGIKVLRPDLHQLEALSEFKKKKKKQATMMQGTALGILTGTFQHVDHTIVDLESGAMQLHRDRTRTLLQRNKTFVQLQRRGVQRELLQVFFNAIKARYHEMYEEGFLSGTAITLLREAADMAGESGSDRTCIRSEWEHVNASLKAFRSGRLRMMAGKIPTVSAIVEYESIVVHVQALGAYIHAHEKVLEQDIVQLNEFEVDVKTSCHMATAAMEHINRTNPGFVKLVSTLLMAQMSVRYKRDKVNAAFSSGLLDAATTKTLVEVLDQQLSKMRDFYPKSSFFRTSAKEVTIQHEVEKHLKKTRLSGSPDSPDVKVPKHKRAARLREWHSSRANFVLTPRDEDELASLPTDGDSDGMIQSAESMYEFGSSSESSFSSSNGSSSDSTDSNEGEDP